VQDNSRKVTSNQPGPHPKLEAVVARHLATAHREPLRAHNVAAYETLRNRLEDAAAPLVLDSFCGTGHSTAALAARHTDCLVVGIDQSASRLARHPGTQSSNYLLLQANCEAIWAQLVRDGITLRAHYLLYPNPWPKAAQLQRRVHGHPGFADLVRLGGAVELRSNWALYVEEFCAAMALAGHSGTVSELTELDECTTLFERKYHRSGHSLWVYRSA
jgi:tRNA G46 methylase TrmB